MLILHAAFYRDSLRLWGESTPREGLATRSDPAYPYCADGAALQDSLARIGLSLTTSTAASAQTIWLPTRGAAPLPSSPLLGEPPPSRKPIILAPWSIPTVTLSPADATDLLTQVRDRPALEPGVMAGDDLRYWSEALTLAGALVYRQQVLPTLIEAKRAYRACWTPVFLGEDGSRLERLARAMPPAARAIGSDHRAMPDTAPRAVLRAFLDWSVDYLVRQAAGVSRVSRVGKTSTGSLHDRWLHALCAADGAMSGDKAELKPLAKQIRDWQRPLLRLLQAPSRLCFRLEEPESTVADDDPPLFLPDDATEWRINYLLQARADPSLLVAAEAIWQTQRGTGPGLKTLGSNPREDLLAALGQAASLSPAVAGSLKQAQPVGYALDTAGAFHFLSQEAPLLEQNGFGVLLPAAWAGKRRVKLATQAKVKPRFESKAGMTLDAVLDVEWEIVLGDAGLTAQELLALAQLKAPLVRVRGQWVQLSAAEIQAALELQRQGGAALSGRELLRMAMPRPSPSSTTWRRWCGNWLQA